MRRLANFTCFRHHNSLNVEACNINEWLEIVVNNKRASAEKWDSPGFFPHVILERRYEQFPNKLTGYIQFDIDSDKYLKFYDTRASVMSAIFELPECHLVAHSFSKHGIWGLVKTSEEALMKDFKEGALKALHPLTKELHLDLDLSVSSRLLAFRLIPEGMMYLTKFRR